MQELGRIHQLIIPFMVREIIFNIEVIFALKSIIHRLLRFLINILIVSGFFSLSICTIIDFSYLNS